MSDPVPASDPRAPLLTVVSAECGFAWDTMTEVEIVDIPPLKPREQSLLEMHSMLNVLNVLRGELTLIGLELAGDDALLGRSLSLCAALIADLQSPSDALAGARAADANARLVMAEVESALDRYPEGQSNPEIKESLDDLGSVFKILGVCARELLARAHDPEQWVVHSANALRADFVDVFTAIARNSHGRFRIAFDSVERQPDDYLLTLQITGARTGGILMPAALPDSIRDLAANSRKYTPIGGRIAVTLDSTTDYLTLQVEDTGRGIAAEDIQNVVHFGKRGRNVGDVRTRGGGFGLTKAFLMTKQFGGRFWITSDLGRGTRVRLQIPVSAGGPYRR